MSQWLMEEMGDLELTKNSINYVVENDIVEFCKLSR